MGVTYDKSKLSVGVQARVGEQRTARVVNIESGFLRDLLNQGLGKWPEDKLDDPAIMVTVEFDGQSVKKLVHLPNGWPERTEAHPKSALALWKANFGDFPFVGQEVKVVADVEGRFKVHLIGA